MFGALMAGTGGVEAARMYVSVGANTQGAMTGLAAVDAKTKQTGSTLGGLPKIAKFAAAGLAGALVLSAVAAISFEDAFAGVRKTVDTDAAGFAQLETDIRDMAKSMPLAATEIAGIAEQAGALGVKAKDIKEFTRVAALIGVTTDVSSQQAATSLGQLSNILGLTQKDYERFGSTLVDLGNKGASTESQILEIAARTGAAAKLLDISAASTLGWASAVANLGIEAEAGGSSLQRFFLEAARGVAGGGDALEAWATTAGMSADKFKQSFEQDAGGALQSFIVGLGKLSQAEQLATLTALGFDDIRISRALLGLAGNTDNLTSSLQISGAAWESNTAMAVEAQKRFDTTASKIAILWNNVVDLGISIGQLLLPAIGMLADGLGFVAGMLAKLPAPVWVGIAAAIATALVPALWAMVPALGTVTGLFAALLSPIALIAIGVGLLAAAWSSNFLGIRDITASVVGFIGGLLARMIGFYMEAAEIVIGVAKSIPGPWQDGAKDMALALDEAHAAVDRWRDGVVDGAEGAADGVVKHIYRIDRATGRAAVDLSRKAPVMRTAMRNLVAGMSGEVVKGAFHITGKFGQIPERSADHLAKKAPDMRTAMEKLIARMPGAVEKGVEVITGKFGQIPERGADAMLEQQWRLKDATKQLVEFMDSALSPAKEKAMIRGFLASKALAQGLHHNNPLIRQKAREMRAAAIDRLSLLRGDGERGGKNLAEGLASGIQQYAHVAYEATAGMLSYVGKLLPISSPPKDPRSPLANIYGVGGIMVRAIADGITGNLGLSERAGLALSKSLKPGMEFGLMMSGSTGRASGAMSHPRAPSRRDRDDGQPLVVNFNSIWPPTAEQARQIADTVDKTLHYRRHRASAYTS